MNHTQGPWKTRRSDDSGLLYVHNGIVSVANVYRNGLHGMPTQEDWGNAYLIAAAPDLLSACEAVLAADGQHVNIAIAAFAQMRAAIAKAKGGAS